MSKYKFPATSFELLKEVESVAQELDIVNDQLRTVKRDLDKCRGSRQENRLREQFQYLIKSKAKLIDQKQFWSELEERKRTSNRSQTVTTVVSLKNKIICEKNYFKLQENSKGEEIWKKLDLRTKTILRKERIARKSSSDISSKPTESLIDLSSSNGDSDSDSISNFVETETELETLLSDNTSKSSGSSKSSYNSLE